MNCAELCYYSWVRSLSYVAVYLKTGCACMGSMQLSSPCKIR